MSNLSANTIIMGKVINIKNIWDRCHGLSNIVVNIIEMIIGENTNKKPSIKKIIWTINQNISFKNSFIFFIY